MSWVAPITTSKGERRVTKRGKMRRNDRKVRRGLEVKLPVSYESKKPWIEERQTGSNIQQSWFHPRIQFDFVLSLPMMVDLQQRDMCEIGKKRTNVRGKKRTNVRGKKENGKLEDVEKRRKGKVMSIKMRNGIANGEMRGRKGGGRLLISPFSKRSLTKVEISL